MTNSDGLLFKKPWEFYENQLVIQDRDVTQLVKYKTSYRGGDSLSLTGEKGDVILITEAAFFKEERPVLSAVEIADKLTNSSWKLKVTSVQEPPIKMSALEFLNDSTALFFGLDGSTEEYSYGNIMRWDVFTDQKLTVIKMEGVFDYNVFVDSFLDSLILGDLVPVLIEKDYGRSFQKIEMSRMQVDYKKLDDVRNALKGEWRNASGKLEPYKRIPDRLAFIDELGQLSMMTPGNPESYLNRSPISPIHINNTAELLLLNNLKSWTNDIIKVREFGKDTIKLKFPRSIMDYTFIKTGSMVNEDDYFLRQY